MTVLYLNSPLNLAAHDDKLPLEFSGVVYSGGVMQDFFGDDFVIDLAATNIAESMPLLFEHQREKVIGNIDSFTKGNELSVSGPFYSDIDNDAKLVATKSQRGTQYQMSMGLFDAKTDFINSGSVTVNGQTYNAPIEVVRGGTIRESSIVILGADDQTNAQFFSKHHEDKPMAASKPDTSASDDAALQKELSELKTQVIELTAKLELEKSAAQQAVDDKEALALKLSAISDAQRETETKALFLSVGKEYTAENAKPYIEMSQASFDAVAGDFKAKKPTVESLELGAYDFGADEDDKGKETFSLTQCAADQEAFAVKMEGRAN
jgi:hypothetical protein